LRGSNRLRKSTTNNSGVAQAAARFIGQDHTSQNSRNVWKKFADIMREASAETRI
jgi:hypothetical protein